MTLAESIFLSAIGPGAVRIGSGKPRRTITALLWRNVSIKNVSEFFISVVEKSPLRTSFVPIQTNARSGINACAAVN